MKSLGSSHPGCAGRLRQGVISNFYSGTLEIIFSSLFAKQYEFVNEETNRQSIEASLEEFYEAPLRISMILQKDTSNTKLTGDDYRENSQINEPHSNDPDAQIVQKVFHVTIKNVFQDAPLVQYHLGKSCNFKEN